ncbi:hypothetical protein GLOIN_2v1472692 [Rhizophagus clarus]|uniref:Endonuclease/exonuclease/phosphatase domain-containing protein n=1 Tax=Rhizophagus clarus TaxID=94130 RepID=A0A8H3R2U6_9GLOM|nr:hypothetical protein GLOIN_2v1472692 [Rhizophagus clarus]
MMSQQTIISPSTDGIMDIKNTFKILTLNISGLNTTIKQEHLINFMNINDIKILGVTEMKLKINTRQYLYKNHKDYKACYAKYVTLQRIFKGCMLVLTLFLKGKIQFTIIVIYNYANNTMKKEITELYVYVKDFIKEEIKHKTRIIIIEDFNISYDDYQQKIKNTNSLFHKNPLPIWHRQDFKSHIDFIWVNYEIISDLIYASTNKPHIVSTDYSVVTAYFSYDDSIFKNKAVAIAKRYNTYTIINYKVITQDEWKAFTEQMEELCPIEESTYLSDSRSLNQLWNEIKSIFKQAFTKLPHKKDNPFLKQLPESIIDSRWYTNLIQEITIEEWYKVIIDLSQEKVEGPSKISNELIQHIELNMFKLTLQLTNLCLTTGDISAE